MRKIRRIEKCCVAYAAAKIYAPCRISGKLITRGNYKNGAENVIEPAIGVALDAKRSADEEKPGYKSGTIVEGLKPRV